MSRKNRGGRPPGQKNRNYVSVMEIPPACPSCGGTELRAVPGADPIAREITGQINGREYTQVIWRRKQCACGQFLKVRTYEKETTAGSLIT